MERIEKTVFISYRRTNIPWALNIFQNLTYHGYDVFFDYDSIASGDFERSILEEHNFAGTFSCSAHPFRTGALRRTGRLVAPRD
jgi:TIR domain-containing protein